MIPITCADPKTSILFFIGCTFLRKNVSQGHETKKHLNGNIVLMRAPMSSRVQISC